MLCFCFHTRESILSIDDAQPCSLVDALWLWLILPCTQQPLEKPVYFFKLHTACGTATFSRRGRDLNLFLTSARCLKLNAAVDLFIFWTTVRYKCLIFVTVWCYYCEPVEGTLTFHFSVSNFQIDTLSLWNLKFKRILLTDVEIFVDNGYCTTTILKACFFNIIKTWILGF